ncbi:MAG TPA: hypothetical protein VJ842_05490 [Pyrinomonadaceae bacterium]|nr:hypothetical protein [Pyrinomonadaceae bacterium]
MCKSTTPLLLRLTVAALTFAFALTATFVWRIIPVFPSRPDSSQRLVGVMTPAVVEARTWRDELVKTESIYWNFRRDEPAARFFDVNQPVALATPDADAIITGCMTLTVTVDAERTLRLNTDAAGSLDDPSKLTVRLAEIFRDREVNRAYKPGMEYRTELPSHERIEKTIIVVPSPSLSYGEVLEVLRLVEQTGASPIILQAGNPASAFNLPAVEYVL